MKYTIATLGLAAISALAVKVTFPTETQGWETKGSELIQWDSVSTDPTTLDIQLFTPNNNDGTTIAQNVSVSTGSYIYTPSSDLTAGSGYRISLISSTNSAGILAQSPMFNVTQGTSTVTPTSGMPSQTSSMSMTSASGSASASASHTSGAASHLGAPTTGLAFLILGAIGALA